MDRQPAVTEQVGETSVIKRRTKVKTGMTSKGGNRANRAEEKRDERLLQPQRRVSCLGNLKGLLFLVKMVCLRFASK